MRYEEDRRTKKTCLGITISYYKKLLSLDRFYHVLDMINTRVNEYLRPVSESQSVFY